MDRSLSSIQIFLYGLRSLIFYLGYGLSAFIFAPIALVLGIFLPFKARAWFINRWSWFVLLWLRLICGISVDLRSKVSLNKLQPGLILSNHQSTWETLFLQLYFCPAVTVLKKELLNIPFFGWGLRLLKPIVIDRSKPRLAGRQFLEQGQRALENQYWVLLFPEGTRVAPGEKQPLSIGGFKLAVNQQVPIIPVYHNAGMAWPARQFIKTPGRVVCIIGDPILPCGSAQELAEQYQQALATMENEALQ